VPAEKAEALNRLAESMDRKRSWLLERALDAYLIEQARQIEDIHLLQHTAPILVQTVRYHGDDHFQHGRLDGRQVFVELGTESTGTGRRLEDLRIGFEVDMNDGSEPNSAKVEVFGVGRETVAMMQEEDALIRLHAGYVSTTGWHSDGSLSRAVMAASCTA